MVEVTSLTLGGIITVIVLQLLDLGQTYFKNLKRSECCGIINMEMKDDTGQHYGDGNIVAQNVHIESRENSGSDSDSSEYNT